MKSTKTLMKSGKSVDVSSVDEDINGHPHVRVTAVCGDESYEEVLTIGAVDGKRVFQTQGQMQADFDAHCDKVAEMAAWRSYTKELRAKLV